MAQLTFGLLSDEAAAHGCDGILNVPEHFHNAFLFPFFILFEPNNE
jgi:hypothetical protein